MRGILSAGKSRGGGFSLLELIVTIIVIGILASIAMPGFTRAIERARVQDVEATLAAAFQAERLYLLDNADFGTWAELIADHYITDPDGGNSNTEWNFASANVTATTFTLTATRTGGGWNGNTVSVTQAFDGVAYGGNHPLR